MNRILREVSWQSCLWSSVAAVAGVWMRPAEAPAYVMGLSVVLCLAGILALLNAADQRAKNRKQNG